VTSEQTPVLDPSETRALLDSIDTASVLGLRDRALIGHMVYSDSADGCPARDLFRIHQDSTPTIFEKLPRSKARKSVSHSTLCWREMDSNYQSPVGSFADISQVCEMWYFAKISSTRFECLVGGVLRPPPVLHDVGPRDLPHMLVLDMGIARVVGPGYWHSRAEPEVRCRPECGWN
jgi:hypothetical protein